MDDIGRDLGYLILAPGARGVLALDVDNGMALRRIVLGPEAELSTRGVWVVRIQVGGHTLPLPSYGVTASTLAASGRTTFGSVEVRRGDRIEIEVENRGDEDVGRAPVWQLVYGTLRFRA